MSAETGPHHGALPQAIGRYRILERLASDSVDDVYKGFDPMIERPVVVKVFALQLDDAAATALIKQTFYDEMRRTGVLMHQGIATLYDAGETSDALFAASELVDGVTLTEFLATHADMDLPLRVSLIAQMVDALEYARALGVTHLNLKPTNVLVSSDYVLKVGGFGVAPVLDVLTTSAAVEPRPPSRYGSPERNGGLPGDHRSDVYSLAALALEVLGASAESGRRYDEELPAMPALIAAHGVLAERWTTVFARGLARDPAGRTTSAAALKFDVMLMLGVDETAARIALETSRALGDAWPPSPDPHPQESAVDAMFAETLLQPGSQHAAPSPPPAVATPADDDGETMLMPESTPDSGAPLKKP
ncbi:MAG: serine/threonine-protein kinase [Acidobacteriota bacterium]